MKVNYIELLGAKHPLCYSLSAMEELCDVFGSLDAMFEEITNDNIGKQVKALNTMLGVLMKAGRIYAEAIGEELPPKLKCKPSDLIDMRDPEAVKAILGVISDDSKREVEAQSKNVETKQGE